MKFHWQIGALLCAGVALVALRGEASEVRGQDDLEARVLLLEQKLIGLEAANAELALALGTSRALIDETTAYLEAQAASATALSATLSKSEELGFTAGINYESRVVLLAGWREHLKTLEQDVPGARQKKAAPADATGRPGR